MLLSAEDRGNFFLTLFDTIGRTYFLILLVLLLYFMLLLLMLLLLLVKLLLLPRPLAFEVAAARATFTLRITPSFLLGSAGRFCSVDGNDDLCWLLLGSELVCKNSSKAASSLVSTAASLLSSDCCSLGDRPHKTLKQLRKNQIFV